jgi:hypothetical protein
LWATPASPYGEHIKGGYMEYKFTGALKLKEYIQWCRKIEQKRQLILIIAFPICFTLIFYSFNLLLPLKIILGILAGGLMFFIGEYIIYPIKLKKIYNSDKTSGMELNYFISEEFISITSENYNNKITRENIYKIKFDKDSIYILFSINKGIVIKKRYFTNENDFDELKLFIIDKYKK